MKRFFAVGSQIWCFVPLFVIVLACIAGVTEGVMARDTTPQPPELTTEQKLTFQVALTNFYKQVAIGNNLRALIIQNGDAVNQARAALRTACPGEVVGLDQDAAECKPKAEVPKTPDPK